MAHEGHEDPRRTRRMMVRCVNIRSSVAKRDIQPFAFFVWAFVCFVFHLASAAAQPLPYKANAKHLGVVNCANSLCHGSITKWKDSPVLQNEYVTWSRVDKHATKAYQVLFEERSRKITRNLGI